MYVARFRCSLHCSLLPLIAMASAPQTPELPPMRPIPRIRWMSFDDAMYLITHAKRYNPHDPERGWHIMSGVEACLLLAEVPTRFVFLGRRQTMQFRLQVVARWVPM